jgi:hypothetical protein
VAQAGEDRKPAVAAPDGEGGIPLRFLPLGHVVLVVLQGLVIVLIFIADLIVQIVIILSPPPGAEAAADAKNYAGVNSETFENRPPLATGNQPDPIEAHGASVQCAKATGERFSSSDDRLGSIEPTEAEGSDSVN